MRIYPGSCHCGAVHFEVECDPVEMTTRDCTLCTKRNALMVKVPETALQILAGEQELSTYQWKYAPCAASFLPTLRHLHGSPQRVDPTTFGVNVFCLEGLDKSALPVRATEGISMSPI